MILNNDFQRQWADLGADVLAAVDRVGKSGWYVLGQEVRGFERELAKLWGKSRSRTSEVLNRLVGEGHVVKYRDGREIKFRPPEE